MSIQGRRVEKSTHEQIAALPPPNRLPAAVRSPPCRMKSWDGMKAVAQTPPGGSLFLAIAGRFVKALDPLKIALPPSCRQSAAAQFQNATCLPPVGALATDRRLRAIISAGTLMRITIADWKPVFMMVMTLALCACPAPPGIPERNSKAPAR